VEFVDLYRGDPIPDGKKSVALHVVYRSPERTLTGEEADEIQSGILERLREELAAELR